MWCHSPSIHTYQHFAVPFCCRGCIFLRPDNNAHISVLSNIKYAVTLCPFAKWDKVYMGLVVLVGIQREQAIKLAKVEIVQLMCFTWKSGIDIAVLVATHFKYNFGRSLFTTDFIHWFAVFLVSHSELWGEAPRCRGPAYWKVYLHCIYVKFEWISESFESILRISAKIKVQVVSSKY